MVAEGDKEDVDLAVDAAREAFDHGKWPRLTGFVSRSTAISEQLLFRVSHYQANLVSLIQSLDLNLFLLRNEERF